MMATSLFDWLCSDVRISLKLVDNAVANRLVIELREVLDSLGNTIDIDELEIRLNSIGEEIDRQIAAAKASQVGETN